MKQKNKNRTLTEHKGQIVPACQKVITSIEGIFILIYSLGMFFLFLTPLQFGNKLLEMIRAMIVVLLIPLAIFIIPFFVFSTAVLIYYWFSKSNLDQDQMTSAINSGHQKKLFGIHLIFEVFLIFFIAFWFLKSGPR